VEFIKGSEKDPSQRKGTMDSAHLQGLTLGVVLSGGQAPGGHNVIAGIYDYINNNYEQA